MYKPFREIDLRLFPDIPADGLGVNCSIIDMYLKENASRREAVPHVVERQLELPALAGGYGDIAQKVRTGDCNAGRGDKILVIVIFNLDQQFFIRSIDGGGDDRRPSVGQTRQVPLRD